MVLPTCCLVNILPLFFFLIHQQLSLQCFEICKEDFPTSVHSP